MFRQRLTRLSTVFAIWLLMSGTSSIHAQSVIRIDGSSTVYPITKTMADKFENTKKNIIKPQSIFRAVAEVSGNSAAEK